MTYKTVRSSRKTTSIEVSAKGVVIRAPLTATDEEIARFVHEHEGWIETHMAKAIQQTATAQDYEPLSFEEIQKLGEKALKVIPERVAYFAPKVGVTYGRITIRNQRSRWGSCSEKGNLNFNCLLMLTPPQVIDSVVVHELCHRKEMNHSDKFYAQVLKVMPDYWKWDKWLKDNGPVLMKRMENGMNTPQEN